MIHFRVKAPVMHGENDHAHGAMQGMTSHYALFLGVLFESAISTW
jgi:hypothetical protein